MRLDIDSVPCHVPARWSRYTDEQKEAVRDMVQRLKTRHGDRLLTIHVDRLVWESGLRQRWRVYGGYSLSPAHGVEVPR